MRKSAVVVLLAFLGAGGPALGQAQPVQLQLRIVPQMGGFGAASPLTLAGPVNGPVSLGTTLGTRTMRFRIDYRVLDLNLADGIHPDGLCAADFFVIGSPSGVTTDTVLSKGLLSVRERNSGAAPMPGADQTGDDVSAVDPNGGRGLCGPFRGGLSNPNNNADPVNGTVNGLSISPMFTATNLSQIGQDLIGYDVSGTGDGPFLTGNEWYPLYVFSLTAGSDSAGAVTFEARLNPDPSTHNSFAYWRTDSNVPQANPNGMGASITVTIPPVPAPGLSVLAAVAGVMAARRRRGQ